VNRSDETVISLRVVVATVAVAILAMALAMLDRQQLRTPSMRWFSVAHVSTRYHEIKRYIRHAFEAPAPASAPAAPADPPKKTAGSADGR
jgi:hypothetical protein